MRNHRLLTLAAATMLFLAEFVYCHATEWRVGPGRTYTKPSSVAALVSDGDTISIDASTYTADVCRWTAHHLLFRGVGGNAVLASQGNVYGGKAIWVITGDSAVVENITFKDARCVDRNGAGIRLEGHHMVVRSCVFDGNEDGILVGAIRPCTMLIEYCEFSNSGFGDGLSHNLYIGAIDTLIFRFNYTHGCKIGHELKSRADVNFILFNRLATEALGTGSRCIDLPNGGIAVITCNDIQQGPWTQNSNMVGYGLEGLRGGINHQLYLSQNTFVSTRSTALFTSFAEGTECVAMWNNLFFGKGILWPSATTVGISSVANIHRDDANGELKDEQSGNYELNSSSIARDSADWENVPMLASELLNPTLEYVHPRSRKVRCEDKRKDVGAHEFCIPVNVFGNEDHVDDDDVEVVVQNGTLRFPSVQSRVIVWTVNGVHVRTYTNIRDIELCHLPQGALFLQTPTRIRSLINVR